LAAAVPRAGARGLLQEDPSQEMLQLGRYVEVTRRAVQQAPA
jgi:hypothetical protein